MDRLELEAHSGSGPTGPEGVGRPGTGPRQGAKDPDPA